ncbi:hypothetical protein [Longispora urticae]
MTAPVEIAAPRAFVLRRWVDPTGVSGVGVVAHGVRWFDGRVELRWVGTTTGVASSCSYDSVADVLRVHGHDGSTEIGWLPECALGYRCPPGDRSRVTG